MSLRFLRAACVAAVLTCAAVPATALAQPANAPPAASKVDPKAEALVRRVLRAADFEKQIDTMLVHLLPAMRQETGPSDLTPAQDKLLEETTLEVMRETFTPLMLERTVPIYADVFTIPELEAMVAFYESPMGRSSTKKTELIAPRVAAMTQDLMPIAIEAMKARLCEKLDCKAPKANPS